MRKLKVLIAILTLLLFVGVTHVMQSGTLWIKGGGEAIEIPKQEAIRLGHIEARLDFRERTNKPVTRQNPINLDKFLDNLGAEKNAARYVAKYLLKNNTEREAFLQDLDQKSLKSFFGYLSALVADPKLILLPEALNYFGDWRLEKVLDGHESWIYAVAFSQDGNRIVSGSEGRENNLILWNGRTGEKIKVLDGHKNHVTTLAFSQDGNRIVSGSKGRENNLILWNGRTGEKIKVLDGQEVGFLP